jgi:hypothetical protein
MPAVHLPLSRSDLNLRAPALGRGLGVARLASDDEHRAPGVMKHLGRVSARPRPEASGDARICVRASTELGRVPTDGEVGPADVALPDAETVTTS